CALPNWPPGSGAQAGRRSREGAAAALVRPGFARGRRSARSLLRWRQGLRGSAGHDRSSRTRTARLDPGADRRSMSLRAQAEAAITEITGQRSEEHTSELQSRENLVCRLLLEKKKKRIK